MEKDHDTSEDGGNKKEDKKPSASDEVKSTKDVAVIEAKGVMAKMEGMFLAIAQLDPSNETNNEASQVIASKPIYDVDAPGPIAQESAGQILKLTTLDNPIDVDATIDIPNDVDDLASRDDEVAFIISQELKGVYGFSGVEEFTQREPEARNARYAVRTAFETQPKTVGYGEIDLYRCRHWYKDLRFASLIDNPIDGNHTWYYRLVVINPSAPELKMVKHKHVLPRISKFKQLALKFYVSGFAPQATTTSSIRLALENEITIMIVAKKKAGPADTCKSMWEEKNQGIAMIKYCYAVDYLAKTVEIYLQSFEQSAFNFYTMLGFKQLNNHYDDGFELLPRHVRDHLATNKSTESKTSIFHAYEREPKSVAYQLMHLRSGCLRHFQLAPIDEPQSLMKDTNDMWQIWCRFPPPRVRGIRLHYSDTTMRQLFVGLPLLRGLLPPPYSSMPPLTTMFVKGEMTIERRLAHTTENGMKWMSSGELDLMAAIIFFDGRFHDFCFVMPSCLCDSMAIAFAKFVEYQRALKMIKLGKTENLDPTKLAKAIIARFHASVATLAHDYCKLRNNLVQLVIHPNPGILARRVIVFPCNENLSHWSATFVFNAAFHKLQTDSTKDNDGLRACFFRYCSKDPNGQRDVPISQGILWFLNLCVSYDAHERKHSDPSEGKLEWLSPFGDALDGNMLGTNDFPSLRLPFDSEILPMQSNIDNHNCGFGVIATMSMVLRDLVLDDSHSTFDDRFASTALERKTCATNGEVFCDMPRIGFRPLSALPKFKWDTYLPQLREQWFVVFDRLAKLQYDDEPKKLFADYHVPDIYTRNLALISEWPAGNHDLLSEAKASSASASPRNRAKAQRTKVLPKAKLIEANVSTQTPVKDVAKNNMSPGRADKKAAGPSAGLSKNMVTSATGASVKTSGSLDEKMTGKTVETTDLNAGIIANAGVNVTQSQMLATEAKTFQPKQLIVPLKRKVDAVENMAEALLKKIRIKDPVDADKLEKARVPLSDPSPKFCSQSKALCERLAKEFGGSGLPTPTIMKRSDYEAEIEQYIENSFKAWKWHSAAQHQAELERWARKKTVKGISNEAIRDIDIMIKGLQNDRAKFRKYFANEFKCTQKTLVQSVRFEKATNSFRAKLAWTEEVPVFPAVKDNQKQNNPQKPSHYEYVRQEEEIDVEEEWVKSQFEPMFEQIVNMRQDEVNWTQVPRDVEVFIGKKKIVRLRYVPEHKRSLVDFQELNKRIEAEFDEMELKRRKAAKKGGRKDKAMASSNSKIKTAETLEQRLLRSTPHKHLLKGLDTNDDAEEWAFMINELNAMKEPRPRRTITVPGKWLGRTSDGNTPTLEEEYVRMTFGDCFTDELKQSKRGWVDIPVGDYKPSRLHDHLNLKVIGAPEIQFSQAEGKDLCVSKSLASVFFALGWHDEASKIDAFGEEILKGAAVDALRRVIKHAKIILPPWIIIRQLPTNFNWKNDLKDEEVVVGVLLASDDSCSHAISIHGNFVFDANEKVALRLCDEALDYCTSTETVKSKFVAFKLGYRFFYEGKRPLRRSKMRLPS